MAKVRKIEYDRLFYPIIHVIVFIEQIRHKKLILLHKKLILLLYISYYSVNFIVNEELG